MPDNKRKSQEGLDLLKEAVLGVLQDLDEPSNAHIISENLGIAHIEDIGVKEKQASTSYPLIGNVLEILQEDGVIEYLPEERKYKIRHP